MRSYETMSRLWYCLQVVIPMILMMIMIVKWSRNVYQWHWSVCHKICFVERLEFMCVVCVASSQIHECILMM